MEREKGALRDRERDQVYKHEIEKLKLEKAAEEKLRVGLEELERQKREVEAGRLQQHLDSFKQDLEQKFLKERAGIERMILEKEKDLESRVKDQNLAFQAEKRKIELAL